jgi:hypothetical protein
MENVESLMTPLCQKMFTIQLELEFLKITESVLNIAKLTTTVSATSTHLTQMVLVSA